MMGEPGGGLESLRERLAGMTFLPKIGDEKSGEGRIIIDDEKLGGIAGEQLHAI